ncbi:MAG: M15 family metallopeptidase [bacterium]|nr:M15 family metallopeptidase [bacterium]
MTSYIQNRKIFNIAELQKIKVYENNEELVDLNKVCADIICKYKKIDMKPYIGNSIFVRKTVAQKLNKANNSLKKINPNYKLKVVYGYRHPVVQKKYFIKRKDIIRAQHPDLSEDELNAITHNFVAMPEVAGHVTGGAVDVTIVDDNGELDMGTNIADYTNTEVIKTFSKNISKIQAKNRKLLHDSLTQQNFAPFYGEWWHFSYGDREWAAFYGKKKSLYSLLDFKKNKPFL